jgi:hypothetical protein
MGRDNKVYQTINKSTVNSYLLKLSAGRKDCYCCIQYVRYPSAREHAGETLTNNLIINAMLCHANIFIMNGNYRATARRML